MTDAIERLWVANDLWPDSPAYWLMARGLSPETIERYHFGYISEGHFADSISIPVLDGLARYRATRFRRLSGLEEKPKYEGFKHERVHLFNVSSVRHKKVYLTEGEFDATLLEQLGRHAVGIPGVNNFKDEWRWLFTGNEVRLVLDGEVKGTDAWKAVLRNTHRLKGLIEPIASDFVVVELPIGHDVSSLYLQDPAELEEVLAQYDDR